MVQCLITVPNTTQCKQRIENVIHGGVFLTKLDVFGILMKYFVKFLISLVYLYRNLLRSGIQSKVMVSYKYMDIEIYRNLQNIHFAYFY